MGQGSLGVFPGLAQMFGDDRGLDFFGKGLFKGGFTAEDHDGVAGISARCLNRKGRTPCR